MREPRRMATLGRWYLPVLAAVYLLAAAVIVWVVNRHDRAQALEEAQDKAELLLARNEAVERYVKQELVPSVRALSGAQTRDVYDPAWMSSTYLVRKLDDYVGLRGAEPYRSKKVAVNARVPSSEADPLERAFLEEARRDPSVRERKLVRTIDGEPWLEVLEAGAPADASCLECHGTPSSAPAGVVWRYGTGRGFGRQAGEIFYARAVRFSLRQDFADANRFSAQLSAVLLAILAALFVAQAVVGRRFLLAREHLEHAVAVRTQELAEAHRVLATSERLATVGTLASGLAHEINNPLSSVLANVRWVREELARNEPLDRGELCAATGEAVEGAERVHDIVHQLQSFAEAHPDAPVLLDPRPELLAAAALCRHGVERRARFEVDVPEALPFVRLARADLGQVLVNLLVNAAQAIPPRDGGKHLVRLAARTGPGELVIEVSDTGTGIAAEHLPHLFDPFFTTRESGQGQGLGLSVAHGIVTRAGGRIEVETAPDEGARFRVILPAGGAGAGA